MPDQTFSEELYDDTALKDAVDRMANLIKTHATKTYVDELNEKVAGMLENKQIKITPLFVNDNNITSTGGFTSHSKRIATEKFMNVSSADAISYSIPSGYRMYGCFYSSANRDSFVSNFGWLTGEGTITPSGDYMRIGYASIGDQSDVIVSDADNLILSYSYYLKNTFSNLVNNVGDLQSNYANKTYKWDQQNDITDLNEIKSIGVKALASNIQFINAPDNYTGGGTLFTFNAYSVVSNTRAPFTQLIQMIISTSANHIWMRHCNSSYVWRDWIDITDFIRKPIYVAQTKWLALGDSITYGVYSDASGAHDGASKGYVKLLADALGYVLNNQGVRGMGYIASGSNGIQFSDVLTTVEALTVDYNLVTVSLGINDYNTSSVTLNDLETIIRNSIQRLSTKFPTARLVYITPLNSNRRGTVETNYCYGYEYGGRSLKDIADLIKATCDEYGVECIYASKGFLFNSYNMSTLLPDNTHPSLAAHELIAKNMVRYLQF